jgi:hypothetical protein
MGSFSSVRILALAGKGSSTGGNLLAKTRFVKHFFDDSPHEFNRNDSVGIRFSIEGNDTNRWSDLSPRRCVSVE